MNRLIHATSPYLLQHAHNPVDWFPWGNEALEKAQRENKPILVSIGYSACHWCHVMERECFEKEQLASIMNEYFVCIKVDREERPDVDQLYMEAVQLMGVHGGWPLNVFLTPDCKPFYGGTYFPPANWERLLKEIHRVYAEHPSDIAETAEQFRASLNRAETHRYGITQQESLEKADVHLFAQAMKPSFDNQFGGFNRAPKFPMPTIWQFLLRQGHVQQDQESLSHVHLTLQRMLQGGIYDTLVGGFARYSVDSEWFAPHFEKMLYDNGQLLSLYAEAFSQSKNEEYKEVLLQTISWLKDEMTHPSGGFYSALDADSEGVEGKFYCWTFEELQTLIPSDELDLFCFVYSIKAEGNWEHDFNILYRTESLLDIAAKFNMSSDELHNTIIRWRSLLVTERAKKIRPGLDDKILASWNGLALKGICEAARVLHHDDAIQLAIQNAEFIHSQLWKNGVLYRTWKNENASIHGFLEDYAAVADGMIALYEITFDEKWLNFAIELANKAIEEFYDEVDGFFFYTSIHSESLIARKKELFDNVIPSSNSMIATVLYKLGLLLYKDDWTEAAQGMLGKMKRVLKTDPSYLTNWALLYQQVTSPTHEIIISGPDALTLRKELDEQYIPLKMVAGTVHKSTLPCLENRIHADSTWIYYCRQKTCQKPIQQISELLTQLSE